MKRNKFNLSHYNLSTFDMGELVPCGLVEVLPGDTFQLSSSALIRVTPLLAPVMHPVEVRIHHWFVPNRLVWDNWEKFITGGPDGFDASVYPTRTVATATGPIGSLFDYYGLPAPAVAAGDIVGALPFRGYGLIFNEWYRDQDLQTALTVATGDGNDTTTNMTLQKVNWEKDYFTSSRPWQQKGPEVTIPVQGNAPIKGIGAPASAPAAGTISATQFTANAANDFSSGSGLAGSNFTIQMQSNAVPGAGNRPQLFADLANAAAANINDLRLAFALQRYEEARARYGSRYTEYLAYLGVKSSDARLQRPEYLGGGRQTIQFSEVLQTSPSTAPTGNVGDIKGHGIGAMRSNRFRKFFEEHGYIHSFISVKPRTMYFQNIPRTWSRRVKEDYWQKELEHIGQQEVFNREIYARHTTPAGVFGYQDRYDEYRRKESYICGEFRNSTLNFWHMARDFSSDPALNASFVVSNPTKRVFAEQTKDSLWCMINHRVAVRRQLSRTGTSHIF